MTIVVAFPNRELKAIMGKDCLCIGCGSSVRTGESHRIEVAGARRWELQQADLCQDCYKSTPPWVWAAE